MKKSIFTALFFSFFLSGAQTIKGFVTDSISNQKLALANIVCLKNNTGTNSNLNGEYTLNIKGHLKDSLKISFVGYKPILFPLNSFIEEKEYDVNFQLVPKENKLEAVVVSQKKIKYDKQYKLNEEKKGNIAMFSLIGHETCCLVENPKKELGRIKSVKLYIRKNKDANFIAKYRIKIYAYNKIENKPGENILNDDIIISPKNKKYQYVIDLEKYKIPFLEDGVCVGIELVDENNLSKKGDKIGPGLRFTYGEEKQLTWFNYRNRGWVKNTFHNRENNNKSNLMVSMTVLMKD